MSESRWHHLVGPGHDRPPAEPTRADLYFGTGSNTEVQVVASLTRLTTPLVRHGHDLRPASWDEALDRAAAAFEAARAQDATTSFGMFSCSKATNEVNFLAQKFVRSVIGSNNIDSCNRT